MAGGSRGASRGRQAALLAALIGILAGVGAGFLFPNPLGTDQAKEPTEAPSSPPVGSPTPTFGMDDPLGLPMPFENLKCTDENILVVGWGDTDQPLEAALVDNPGAKYLATKDSCKTNYLPSGETGPVPDYVAYLGPYELRGELCGQLMGDTKHKNDAVISLQRNLTKPVQCLCLLPVEQFPTLTIGMEATTLDGIYIFALQRMLIDIGLNPDQHVTGVFDDLTAKAVKPIQVLNALSEAEYKTVAADTWGVLRDRACVDNPVDQKR